MKKWMAIILAAACLCSMLVGGTLSVGAEATGRDWGVSLDNIVWRQVRCNSRIDEVNEIGTLSLWNGITWWTLMNYEECTAEGTDYVYGGWDGKAFVAGMTGSWNYVKVSADKFDEYVKKCTSYTEDYRKAVIAYQKMENMDLPFLLYVESANAYVILIDDGTGGYGNAVFRRGYTQNADATYTVYYQGGDWFSLGSEDAEEAMDDTLKKYDSVTDDLPGFDYIRYPMDEFKELLKTNRSYMERNYSDKQLYAWRAGDYCKVTVRENDGCVQILGMEATDRLADDMIETANQPRERKIAYELCEGVRVDGGKAFPEGATVRVEPVEDPNTLTAVNQALVSVSAGDNTAVYAIEALLDGQPLQPFGGVTVTFSLPSSWTAEGLKLYYVADDGTTEAIPVTVDPTAKTVTATLTHFSTYALCHTAAADGAGSSDGSTGGAADRTPAVPTGVSDRVTAVCGAAVLLSLAVLAAVVTGKKRRAQ